MSKNKKINLRGIRIKLLIILMLICNVPVIVSGILSYHNSYEVLENKLQVTSQQNLDEINRSIDNYFKLMMTQVNLLANNYDIKNLDIHPEFKEYALDIITEVKQSNPNILNAYYGDELKNLYIYPATELPAGFDVRTRPWYIDAKDKKGDIQISEVYKDQGTGKSVVTISKAIYDGDKFVGVVGIDIDLSNFTSELSKSMVGKTGHVLIVDKIGVAVSCQDKTMIGTKKPTTMEFWNKLKNSSKGFMQYKDNGTDKYCAYTTNSSTDWKVIANIEKKELINDGSGIKNKTIIISIIIFLIAVLVSWIVSELVLRNVNKLTMAFEKAANGDLSVKVNIKSKDEFGELGDSFNSMIKKIQELINNIKVSGEEILTTSNTINKMSSDTNKIVGEVAATVGQVSEGAYSQAQDISDGVDEFSGLTEEMKSIGKRNENINNISKSTNSLGNDGIKVMVKLIEKTKLTNQSSKEVSEAVTEMTKSSKEIALITETINSISEQTTLLALNASIEAARAGEAGKGFSVVAGEIAKLAEESRNATEEIQKSVQNIKNRTELATASIGESLRMVSEQSESVEQTREIFNKILSSVKELMEEKVKVDESISKTGISRNKILSKMQNISAASEEFSASTEEVSATTEELSASMNEFNTMSQKLEEVASNLENEINKFKI